MVYTEEEKGGAKSSHLVIVIDPVLALLLKIVSPKPDCFVTYINALLMKKVFYITKRKWEPNI